MILTNATKHILSVIPTRTLHTVASYYEMLYRTDVVVQTFPNFALSYIPQHNDARMVDVAGVGEGGEIKDRLPSQE